MLCPPYGPPGCVTTVGGKVPATVDMAGAWLLKTQPTVDSNLFLGTLDLLEDKENAKEKKKE